MITNRRPSPNINGTHVCDVTCAACGKVDTVSYDGWTALSCTCGACIYRPEDDSGLIIRPNYTDGIARRIGGGSALLRMGFDVVEVKHDGRWAVIKIEPSGLAVISSRSGKYQGEFMTDLRPDRTIILLGEHMTGTERSWGSESLIVIFDCLHDGLRDLACAPLHERRQAAGGIVAQVPDAKMTMVKQFDLSDRSFAGIWQDVVVTQGHEGLVAKRSLDPYSHGPHAWPHWIRLKETIEHDAVVLGVDGRSLLCMVDGVQWRVAAGVGDRDPLDLIGLKVTLRSNGVHTSGKGRHARFVRVHPEQ